MDRGFLETHQNLFHPGERNLKGKDKDDGSAEGYGEAPDEVHHNVHQSDLWTNACEEIVSVPLTSLGYKVGTEKANMGRTSM